MPRYHLHPATGEPGRCRATVSCPFGSLESEHYDSPEAARAAFEEAMGARTLAARHSRARSLREELVGRALETRLKTLPPGEEERRLLLASILARYSEAATEEAKAVLTFRLEEAAYRCQQLRREDLAECYRWALSAMAMGRVTEWYAHRVEAQGEVLAEARARGEGVGEVEAELERLKAEQVKMAETEQARDEVLATRPFSKEARPLATGDTVYDGVTEVTFVTAEGEETTVREVLSRADAVHSGRASIAHGRALEQAQEAAQELAGLLSREDGSLEIPRRGHFAGAPGWSLLGHGFENNVYLHEPTQLVFKVPHEGSIFFAHARGEGQKKRVLKRAVQLVEDRYAGVEGCLRKLEEEKGVSGVDYLKTYFLHASTKGGESLPLVVQPKLDWEVCEKLDPAEVYFAHPDDPLRTTTLANQLREAGFSDTHGENVIVDSRTGRVLLLDCLFVPEAERWADYQRQGLVEPEAAAPSGRWEPEQGDRAFLKNF